MTFDTHYPSTPRRLLALALLAAAVSTLTGCFPRGPGPRLAHFDSQAPTVGDPAPDFELTSPDGERLRLSEIVGDGPIVLQLGSHSCPVYRYRRHWMDDLVLEYQDRVRFLVVYTLEAHPVGSESPYLDGEWDPWINRVTGVRISEPATMEARRELALFSQQALKMPQEMLVDGMDNEVWQAYGAASAPAFVIDREGRIALRQVWIVPKEIRETLDRLLAEEGG